MRFDSHMHTPLCGHAVGLPVEFIPVARQRGLDVITFTCHIPMEHSGFRHEGIRMRVDELDLYRKLVEDARRLGEKDGIDVLCGIEAEIFPDERYLADMDALLAREPFDYVLGSLHHQLPGYRAWLKENDLTDPRAIADVYFLHLAEAARSERYDSLAHPDLIGSYGTIARPDWHDHEATIRLALEAARDSGVCWEVNTSGLDKEAYISHPDPIILPWAAEVGVRLTLGSDSHMPSTLARHFEAQRQSLLPRRLDRSRVGRSIRLISVPVLW